MTRMIPTAQVATVARIHAAPPLIALHDCMAANVGLTDAKRFGARARLYLRHYPALLHAVERLFGFGVENTLADARLESIRSFALAETLAGRAAPAEMLVRRWSQMAL